MTVRPQIAETRNDYTFWPGTQAVPFSPDRASSTAPTPSPPTRRSPRGARKAFC